MRFHFGDCVLDTGRRELRRAGRLVPLKPKGFRLLQVLIERRPAAVSQAELRRLLWPDTQLGGTSLARIISDVRTAVNGGSVSHEPIRTLHRFGYAFSGWVEEEADQARPAVGMYAVQYGRQLVPLIAGENLIGRSGDAHIAVACPDVSRRHARLLVNHDSVSLEDLGSRNGTFVGSERVQSPVELKHLDRIGIGPAVLVFLVVSEEDTTQAALPC